MKEKRIPNQYFVDSHPFSMRAISYNRIQGSVLQEGIYIPIKDEKQHKTERTIQ